MPLERTRVDAGRELRRFFGLTLLLSWGLGGLWLLGRAVYPGLPGLQPGTPAFSVVQCAPSLAAFVLAARAAGWSGVNALLRSLTRPFHWPWLLVASLGLPLLAGLLAVIDARPTIAGAVQACVAGLPLLLRQFLNLAAWGEEFGWRGFALPRLLSMHGPLTATIIIGAAWVLWHVPAFLLGGVMVSGATVAGFASWSLATLALSAWMTLLHRRAGGNLLVAGLLPHAAINALGQLGLWDARPLQAVVLAATAALAWAGLGRGGPGGDARASC